MGSLYIRKNSTSSKDIHSSSKKCNQGRRKRPKRSEEEENKKEAKSKLWRTVLGLYLSHVRAETKVSEVINCRP